MVDWSDSLFKRAYKRYSLGDSRSAYEWFLRGANSGNSDCMIWVGFLIGDGVIADEHHQNEIWWYKRAWSKGNLLAPNNLAVVYKSLRNFGKAQYWYQVAIATGDGDAKVELAKLYIAYNTKFDVSLGLLKSALDDKYITEQSIEDARALLDRYS